MQAGNRDCKLGTSTKNRLCKAFISQGLQVQQSVYLGTSSTAKQDPDLKFRLEKNIIITLTGSKQKSALKCEVGLTHRSSIFTLAFDTVPNQAFCIAILTWKGTCEHIFALCRFIQGISNPAYISGGCKCPLKTLTFERQMGFCADLIVCY